MTDIWQSPLTISKAARQATLPAIDRSRQRGWLAFERPIHNRIAKESDSGVAIRAKAPR